MTQNKNRKTQYISRNIFISAEYVIIDENGVLKGDFKTAKEAISFKENNPNTDIYILKTFKMK